MTKGPRTALLLATACIFGVHCAYGVEPLRPAGDPGGGDTGTGTPGTGGTGGVPTSSTTPTSSNPGTGGDTTSSSSAGTGGDTTSSSSTGMGGGTTSSSSAGTGGDTTSSSSTGVGGVGGSVGGFPDCLVNLPANCIPCQVMNQSDKPKCQQYLDCYINNVCIPTDPCGQLDGVCGVNTIGGGNAPRDAAIATYMCACP